MVTFIFPDSTPGKKEKKEVWKVFFNHLFLKSVVLECF